MEKERRSSSSETRETLILYATIASLYAILSAGSEERNGEDVNQRYVQAQEEAIKSLGGFDLSEDMKMQFVQDIQSIDFPLIDEKLHELTGLPASFIKSHTVWSRSRKDNFLLDLRVQRPFAHLSFLNVRNIADPSFVKTARGQYGSELGVISIHVDNLVDSAIKKGVLRHIIIHERTHAIATYTIDPNQHDPRTYTFTEAMNSVIARLVDIQTGGEILEAVGYPDGRTFAAYLLYTQVPKKEFLSAFLHGDMQKMQHMLDEKFGAGAVDMDNILGASRIYYGLNAAFKLLKFLESKEIEIDPLLEAMKQDIHLGSQFVVHKNSEGIIEGISYIIETELNTKSPVVGVLRQYYRADDQSALERIKLQEYVIEADIDINVTLQEVANTMADNPSQGPGIWRCALPPGVIEDIMRDPQYAHQKLWKVTESFPNSIEDAVHRRLSPQE